jgi:hypothetical protein
MVEDEMKWNEVKPVGGGRNRGRTRMMNRFGDKQLTLWGAAAAALAEEEDMKLVMEISSVHQEGGGLDWIGFGAGTALLDSIDLRTEA